MNTAQPASLPPANFGSGGINRSTNASTVAPSSAVKNSQPPGCVWAGGIPAEGCHGNFPAIVRARAGTRESRKDARLPANTLRRCVAMVLLCSRFSAVAAWRRRYLAAPRTLLVGDRCLISHEPVAEAALRAVITWLRHPSPGYHRSETLLGYSRRMTALVQIRTTAGRVRRGRRRAVCSWSRDRAVLRISPPNCHHRGAARSAHPAMIFIREVGPWST